MFFVNFLDVAQMNRNPKFKDKLRVYYTANIQEYTRSDMSLLIKALLLKAFFVVVVAKSNNENPSIIQNKNTTCISICNILVFVTTIFINTIFFTIFLTINSLNVFIFLNNNK